MFYELFRKLSGYNPGPVSEVSVCDKTDCKFYSTWSYYRKWHHVTKLPEKFRPKDHQECDYTFTNCTVCKHFKGIDLYVTDEEFDPLHGVDK